MGGTVEALALEEWVARAGDLGMSPVLAQFFIHVESMGGLVFPKVLV